MQDLSHVKANIFSSTDVTSYNADAIKRYNVTNETKENGLYFTVNPLKESFFRTDRKGKKIYIKADQLT